MQKIIKQSLANPFLRFLAIPASLICIWAILTVIFMISYDKSFFVLSYPAEKESFHSVVYNGKLAKGQKITGSIIAQENNLGILAIRFIQTQRIAYEDEDTLVFRIKEHGQKKWYYQNQYRSGIIFDTPFLPFGFPIIQESKGKVYDFELESLHGNSENGVTVSKQSPNLITRYQIPRSLLLSNKRNLFVFLSKKIITSFQVPDIIFASFIFSLPLLFYFLYLIPITRHYMILLKQTKKNYLNLILLLLIFIDALFLQVNSDILYIVCTVAWLIALGVQHKSSKFSFVTGAILIILIAIFYSLKGITIALEMSSWAFLLFAAGVFQEIFMLESYKKVTVVKKRDYNG